jgi:hypothetical protein
LTATLNEEEKEVDHGRDGRISWSLPETGTGEKALTLQLLMVNVHLLVPFTLYFRLNEPRAIGELRNCQVLAANRFSPKDFRGFARSVQTNTVIVAGNSPVLSFPTVISFELMHPMDLDSANKIKEEIEVFCCPRTERNILSELVWCLCSFDVYTLKNSLVELNTKLKMSVFWDAV